MPAGANHAGRTRADRTTISAPVTADERARIERNAARKGLTMAEYIRRRACGDTSRDRMIAAPFVIGELRALLEEVPRSGPARARIETLIETLE